MSKDEDAIVGGIIAGVFLVPLTIGTIFVLSLVQAWSITLLWQWFVVPVFALPILSYAQALGLAYTYNAIKGAVGSYKDHECDGAKTLLNGLLSPVTMVFFGWIVKTFFM